jgi:DNA (cytosine-5)-methyltransferase 1
MKKHLGLFEGIGGFSLAAHWMGWETVAWVEINPDCQKVLRARFSDAIGFDDILNFKGEYFANTIDILTGGFPCQTFSLAGKGAVDLSLWKEMFRVIQEVKPRWVVAENVYGILARKKGYALEVVCSDLESKGYTVLPPVIIPSCSQGAPHRRDRVWIIAYANSDGHKRRGLEQGGRQASQSEIKESKCEWFRYESFRDGKTRTITDPHTQRLQKRIQKRQSCFQKAFGPFQGSEFARIYPKSNWSQFPTESPLSTRNDGLPGKLDRPDARLRTKSIKAGGNAIVPQVAFEIFKAIEMTLQ